ncbi:MAG: tetratricopeptide repeat protein [Bacteroidota bacterium]
MPSQQARLRAYTPSFHLPVSGSMNNIRILFLLLGSILGICSLSSGQNIPGITGGNLSTVERLFVSASTEMIRGKKELALEKYLRVLKLDPKNRAAQYNIAKIYIDLRQMEEAERYAELAAEGSPENYWYQILLRNIYEARGNFSAAIEVQEQVVQRVDAHPREAIQLSELYRRNRQNKQALAALTSYEALRGPQKPFADFKLDLLVALGKQKEALTTLQKLRASDPTYPKYYELEYDLLIAQKEEQLAQEKLEALLRDDPDNGFALLKLAELYEAKGDLAQANTYIAGAFSNEEIAPSRKIQVMTEMLENISGTDPEDIAQLSRLMEEFQLTHPDNPEGKEVEAKVYALQGNSIKAREAYRSSLEADPANLEGWVALLETNWAGAHFPHLFQDAEEVMELYPSQTDVLYYYALGATMLRKWEEAEYAFSKSARLGTMSAAKTQRLQLIQDYAGFLQGQLDSKTFLDKLKRASDNDLRKIYLQSIFPLIHQKNGKRENTHTEILMTYGSQPLWLDCAALTAWKQDNAEAALENWTKAEARSESPLVAEHLGDYYMETGDLEKAKAYWKKALQAGATYIDIQKKLGE